MTPKPRRTPDRLTGTGDMMVAGLSPDDGGSGQSFQDERPIGFWARITGQVSGNKYSYVKVDSGDPTTFAAANLDPEPTSAYEVGLRTDVAVDGSAVVWLEPLRGAAGYGFSYTASSSIPAGTIGQSSGLGFTADDVWDTAGQIILPGAGTYLLSGTATVAGYTSAVTLLSPGSLQARLYNVTQDAEVAGTRVTVVTPQVAFARISGTGICQAVAVVTGPDVIALQGRRTAAPWVVAGFDGLDGVGPPQISYLKLG